MPENGMNELQVFCQERVTKAMRGSMKTLQSNENFLQTTHGKCYAGKREMYDFSHNFMSQLLVG